MTSSKEFTNIKKKVVEGFSKTYGLNRLIYFEVIDNITTAIKREKQLKNWNRAWKIELIEKDNPQWHDLCADIL